MGLAHRISPRETWPREIEAELARATALSPETRASLHQGTLQDSRAQDMAELAASLAVPDPKERMRQYRERG